MPRDQPSSCPVPPVWGGRIADLNDKVDDDAWQVLVCGRGPGSSARRQGLGGALVQCGCRSTVAALAATALLGLAVSMDWTGTTGSSSSPVRSGLPIVGFQSVDSTSPNDFWAVHDLLLLGYDAYFMIKGTEGHGLVQQSALELAYMMPDLHPHAPCRLRIGEVLAAYPQSDAPGREAIIAAAAASWECLPANYDSASVKRPFLPELLGKGLRAQRARMSAPLDLGTLSVCRDSAWPRTCSLWLSLHAMAYRADALHVSGKFLQAAVAVLAGGATMCGGCTLHLHALHKPVLPAAVLRDLGPVH